MFIGLCLGVGTGLTIGLGLLIWFITGNHLKLGIPKIEMLEDDFTGRTKFWANLCIGDSEVEYLPETDCAGNSFARLKVSGGENDQLALAQLDDYSYRPRADFNWEPPLVIDFRLRFSDQNGLGTGGFYLWNNPLGLGSELPNLRPLKWIGIYRFGPGAQMTFSTETDNFRASVMNGRWLDVLTFLGLPFAPPLRLKEFGLDQRHDWTQWHTYRIEWLTEQVNIAIDDEPILSYKTKLKGPLSIVIWYDNNFPQISLKKFDLKLSEVEAPAWLDVDYVKIHPLT